MTVDKEFYNVLEVRHTLMVYEHFNALKNNFSNYPTMGNAQAVLRQIEAVRIDVPENIRTSLPDYFGLTDENLNELERKCDERLKILRTA